MNIIVKSIPNAITCLNLLSGCVAIMFSFNAGTSYQPVGLQGWQLAAICIFAGAFFDFCDGLAARMLHAYSDIGKELDSLSDLVTFGVAPAMLLFNTLEALHPDTAWWPFVAFFIPLMGGLRLARFNVRDAEGDNSVFHGLPIPANAIFWIGYVSWIREYTRPDAYVIVTTVILVSLAMVSNITLPSLKFKNLGLRDNYRRYIIIVATVALFAVYGLGGLMWAMVLYILMSVFTRAKN